MLTVVNRRHWRVPAGLGRSLQGCTGLGSQTTCQHGMAITRWTVRRHCTVTHLLLHTACLSVSLVVLCLSVLVCLCLCFCLCLRLSACVSLATAEQHQRFLTRSCGIGRQPGSDLLRCAFQQPRCAGPATDGADGKLSPGGSQGRPPPDGPVPTLAWCIPLSL